MGVDENRHSRDYRDTGTNLQTRSTNVQDILSTEATHGGVGLSELDEPLESIASHLVGLGVSW